MTSARTIDRREAAVTAALAGAVLVILGYASGIGLRPQSTASAVAPQPEPTTTAPLTPAPTAVAVVPPAAVPAPVAPAAPVIHTHVPAPSASPAPPPSPAPTTPTPSPDPAPSCAPGLLESLVGELPVVGDASTLVSGLTSGLTSGLLGSVPLLGPSPAAATTEPPSALACTLGAVLGPSCCDAEAARTTTVR